MKGSYAPQPAKRRHRGKLVCLAVLALVAAILCGKVFALRSIEVTGLEGARAAAVARQCGLRLGMSMLRVSEDQVRAQMSRVGDVEFVSLTVSYPDRLELGVRSRIPFAQIESYGRLIVTDENGTVIDGNSHEPLPGMPIVTGLEASADYGGQRLMTKHPEKLDAALDILAGLNRGSQAGQIAELNVANVDNIYMISRTGMQIRLRDSGDMDAKLGLLRKTLPAMIGEGNGRGVIDVSSGKSVFFTPPAY